MKIVYTIIALLTCSVSFAQSGRYILDLGIPQSYEPTKAVVKDYGTHQLVTGTYHDSNYNEYFWVAKMNDETVVWSKSIDVASIWYPLDVFPLEILEYNSNGDILLVGRGHNADGKYSAEIIKLNSSGNLVWQKEFSTPIQFYQEIYENNPVIIENDGIILSMAGESDMHIAKIDFNGNSVYSKQLYLESSTGAVGHGYLFIPNHSGGYFAGFQSHNSPTVVSLDASLNVLWSTQILTGENLTLRALYQTSSGNVLVGGQSMHEQNKTYVGELNSNGDFQSFHRLSNSDLYSIDQLFELNDSTLFANTRGGFLKIKKNDWSYDETTIDSYVFNSFTESANGWTFGSAWNLEYFLDFDIDSPECLPTHDEGNKTADIVSVTTQPAICTVTNSGTLDAGTVLQPVTMPITVTNNCYLSVSDETINDLTVYPNPVQSGSTLSFSHEIKNAVIVFIDLQGKTVAETTFAQQVSVPRLNAGIYLVKIIDKKGTVATQRIVVE